MDCDEDTVRVDSQCGTSGRGDAKIQSEAQGPGTLLTAAGPASGSEPGLRCVSEQSEQSMDKTLHFSGDPSSGPRSLDGSEPGPRCVSWQSEQSMDKVLHFKGGPRPDPGSEAPDGSDPAARNQANRDRVFTALEGSIIQFVRAELRTMRKVLDGECSEGSGGEDQEEGQRSRRSFLEITLYFLKKMKEDEMAAHLQRGTKSLTCRRELKRNVKKRFCCVFEGVAKEGKPTLLEEVFTELYITQGGRGGMNQEHEVRQMETSSRRLEEPTIRLEDLLKGRSGRHGPIRTVMTKGVAGIGKTILTRKFSLDWAEGKAQQEIHFIFPLTFRELNVLRGRSFSLVGLVHHFFFETKEAEISRFQDFQVLFILDGLDECQLPLDFSSTQTLTDVSESTSVEVLLVNLIRGNLLPSALLWITTRPAAANQIPPECVDMVTEVRGFTDLQKEDYFRRRFTDEEQASRILSHIRTCRSLHIMCHIPLFCWITATVLEDMLKSSEEDELPRTLTQIYIHYLVLQAKVKKVKFDGGTATDAHWSPEYRKMVELLGKLAFEQLQKGNLIFYLSDLTECGLDLRSASVYSGVFTQVFREEAGLYQDKVFCFVHLSLQEFLAALHVHQTFISSNVNLLEAKQSRSFRFAKVDLMSQERSNPLHARLKLAKSSFRLLHQSAVDEALRSPNGHLDLFLRFLLGLSLPTNQKLLQGLLPSKGIVSQSNQETVHYIKKKLEGGVSVERSINLFHCLNEVNDRSLLEEIQQSLRSGRLSTERLSPSQWSALVFILLSSQEHLEVFDLKEFSASEDTLLRLLPVVKASTKAELSCCNLSERSCEALSSVISSQDSRLRELDLSNNDLQENELKLLYAGLNSPHCPLQWLSLSGCSLSPRSCEALSKVLDSKTFSLKHLDLSNNELQDSEVQLLSEGLTSPNCQLETLNLSSCCLSERSCVSLSLILSCPSSRLKHLDLSNNQLQDSGLERLQVGLESPHCPLETLSLSGCAIAEVGCSALAASLSSRRSRLREVDLSYNHPGDSDLKLQGFSETIQIQWDHGGELRLQPGVRKYFCPFKLDSDSASVKLALTDGRAAASRVEDEQPHPEHPDRFHPWVQLLGTPGVTGRAYWEVAWSGMVEIAVSYRGIERKGGELESRFGCNAQSWCLVCFKGSYILRHRNVPVFTGHPCPPSSGRVGVFVDFAARRVSFYEVSAHSLSHIHTFCTHLTRPVVPGFGLCSPAASVSLGGPEEDVHL